MALQDLTPQLRTRLSRMERAVGWFVFIATALLVAGFAYYVYHTAERKGWFTPKVTYQTGVNNAAGLKVADPVKLMGFNAGEITEIIPNDPSEYFGVTVKFAIKEPNYGYIWADSTVKISADFLGNRYLEVIKGKAGLPTIITTNRLIVSMLKHKEVRARQKELLKAGQTSDQVWTELHAEAATNGGAFYEPYTGKSVCWIHPDESPALNDRLEKVADQIEQALPNILDLTNKIAAVLDNSAVLTSNLNAVALSTQPLLAELRPTVTNLHALTDQIQGPGALGEWLIPTNVNRQIGTTLGSADEAVRSLTGTLDNLANLTSNLNAQVQANTNMLGSISQTVIDADDLVQGLKRHWLLRSAFKTKATNAPSARLKQ